MTSWQCKHCTYINEATRSFCDVCMMDRDNTAESSGSTTNNDHSHLNGKNDVAMTPVSLKQLWFSYGRERKKVVFFNSTKAPYHPLASTTFSTAYRHEPVTFEIPKFCGADRLNASGRSSSITFTFAHKAIMLCKASLFGDFDTFDLMLASSNSSYAQQLGRRVTPFNQTTWDKMICSITRSAMLAKAQEVELFRDCLLATGNAILANVAQYDFVWGVGVPDGHNSTVNFPGSWRGLNVLGWALMEARDFLATQMLKEQSCTFEKSESELDAKQAERPNDGSIQDLCFDYEYGPAAFERLKRPQTPTNSDQRTAPLCVKAVVELTYPEALNMKGQRGQVNVIDMLHNIYQHGLFMFGDASSALNKEIVPALRYIFHEMNQLSYNDEKRILIIRQLVESCLDCQQVQARTIQKIYSDLTSQSLTFEQQLKYSLLPQKEAALNVLITKYHGGPGGTGKPKENQAPYCDLDHTRIRSSHQRAHLVSGYVVLLAKDLGLEGETAAKNDRFLKETLQNIYFSHADTNQTDTNASNLADKLSNQRLKTITNEFIATMSVSEWITTLIADINNQSDNVDRIIDRKCIFEWASANMEGDFKFKIFYDKSRADEFKHLKPNEPMDEHSYQPFLSPSVLLQMLEKAKLIQRKK